MVERRKVEPGSERLSGNMEDYLETILLLQRQHMLARSKAISEQLGVRMASVTSALKKLREKDLIHYDSYCGATLTNKGHKYAAKILQHHEQLKLFLRNALGLSEKKAEENACRMEHVMDKDVIARLSDFAESLVGSKIGSKRKGVL